MEYSSMLVIEIFILLTTLSTISHGKDIVLDFELGCREQWQRSSDTYSSGGVRQPFVTTLEGCQKSCVDNSVCLAALINGNINPLQCWIIKNATALEHASQSVGYMLYELKQRCTSSPQPANQAVCVDTWTRRSGQRRPGGTLVPSAQDTERCLAVCLGNLDCVMFAVHTVGTFECILYMSASDRTSTPIYNLEYQEYELVERCGTAQGPTTIIANQGVCVTWTSLINTNSLFAVQAVGQNTLQQCQAFCISTPACVAIDFDQTGTDTAGCWYHTNPADLNDVYDTLNVNQWRLTRDQCSSSSASSGSSSSPTTAVSLRDSGDCAVWTAFPNVNSLFAEQASSFQTVQACQDFCVSVPECVAIDYDNTGNPATQGCWIHRDPTDIQQTYDTVNVVQYRLSRSCSTTAAIATVTGNAICVSWTRFPNTNSLFAQFAPNRNSVQLCQDFCLNLPSCVGIDFDHTGLDTVGCWYHTDPTDLQTVYDTLNVDQYRANRGDCTTGGGGTTSAPATGPATCAVWTVLPDTNSIEANQFSQYNTIDSCRNYCVSLPTCVAVDFDKTQSPSAGCWVHTNSADLSTVYVAPGVDQHRLSRVCPGSDTSTVTVATGTATSCANWSPIPESNSINAVRFTNYPTLAQCQAFCVSVAQCVAIDFDTTNIQDANGCWVHTDPKDLEVLFDAPGVTQYRLDRSCQTAGPPVTGGICNSWTDFNGRNSINGIPYNTITTLAACQQQCIDLPACVALEFDTTSGADAMCWIHIDATDLETVFTAPNTVTQYRLQRECVSTETSACAQFELTPFQLSANGLPYLDIKETVPCQSLCISLPNCVAFDLDYSTTDSAGCWIHENTDDLLPENTFQANNVDQYRIDRSACFNETSAPAGTATATAMTGSVPSAGTAGSVATGTVRTGTATVRTGTAAVTTGAGVTSPTTAAITTAGCRYSWQSIADTNIPGGIPTRDLTIEGCRQRCISRPPCFAIDIDYNVNSVFCWIHITMNPTQSFRNVTHMVLTRDPLCPETITTTGTTSTTTPATTTGALLCYYKSMVNANANGGSLLGKMPLQRCIDTCNAQYPYCVAVDHRTSDDSCYLQTSLSGRQYNTCCRRYEIYCTSTPCNDSFALFSNRAPTVQGSPLTTVTTLDQCRDACYRDSTCQAFVWGIAARFQPNQKCVLSLGAVGAVAYSADYNMYARQVCNPDALFTTGTTTTPPTPAPGACVLDIVFVVDISGSVAENQPPGVDNLALIRQFLRNIIQPPINVGQYLDRVALVVFESSSRTLYTFADPQTIDSFTYTAINGIPTPAGETNTPEGLDRASVILQSTRPGTQKVVMLITDGQTTQEFRINLAPSVQRIKDSGATRIAIGVTDEISVDDLNSFASGTDYVQTLQSFQDLEAVRTAVLNNILVQCNRPTVPQSGASSASSSAGTTTSSTTTTQQNVPPEARQVAFSVTTTTNQDNGGRVSLPVAISDYNNHFSLSSSQWSVQANGLYFVELCAGLQAGRQAHVRLDGAGSSSIGMSWASTIHDGVDTACRAGLVSPNTGAQVSLVLDSGSLFSDVGHTTMFTGFSVTDTMNDESLSRAVYAVMTTPPSINGPISFTPVIGPSDSSVFDGATGTYTCRSTGPHLFAVTVGVVASVQTQVQITNDILPVELTRNSRTYNGVTTLSRVVILDCSPGRRVQANQLSGSLTNSASGFNYNLTSFTAFPYLPRRLASPVAWQAYKAYIVDTDQSPPIAADPFLFNNVTVNVGGAYNPDVSVMTAPVTGYYFLSISTGASIRKRFTLSLLRNEEVLFNIEHQVSVLPEEDLYSHSVVALLNQGTEVRIVGREGGSFFSGVVGYQAGFAGCLLYTV